MMAVVGSHLSMLGGQETSETHMCVGVAVGVQPQKGRIVLQGKRCNTGKVQRHRTAEISFISFSSDGSVLDFS